MWALLVVGSGAICRPASWWPDPHWLVTPERNTALVLVPIGLASILIGIALLVATTAIYIFGRNRLRTTAEGFSSASRQS